MHIKHQRQKKIDQSHKKKMKTKDCFYWGLISCIFSPSMYSQQDEKESIGTQEVLVIKSYTPSLSDAF